MSDRLKYFLTGGLTVLVLAVVVFLSLPSFYGVSEKADAFPTLEYRREKGELFVDRVFNKRPPKGWLHLSELPEYVWGSVVVSEDWAFFEHSGIDYRQLWRAVRDSLFYGDRLRGASTISQQLAKNLFLSHKRSLGRKILEVRLAAALEAELSKEELLERYLNIVEWGPGVVGLREAARYYFGKQAQALEVREAALLAQLLPSPIRYGESLKQAEVTDYAQKRVEWIQAALIQAGLWEAPLAIDEELSELEDDPRSLDPEFPAPGSPAPESTVPELSE